MEYSYDGRGRVTHETRRIGTWTFPTLSSYNSADRVRTLTYPDTEVVTYTYNAAGQPLAASGVQGGVTTPYLTSQSFDVQGRPTLVQFGNSVSNRYWYYSAAGDSRLNRLSQLLTQTASNAVLSDLRYDYDRLGNVTAVDVYNPQGVLDGAESQRYRYDNLSRLVEVKTAEATPRQLESFSYTDLGNLLTRGTTTYSYTSSKPHAVTHLSSDPASRFAYDNAGNMTTRGSQSLVYDAEGRLTKVQWGGADLEEYTYDGNGTLMRRKLAAQTRQTLHSQDFTSQGTGWTSGWSGSGSVTWNQNPNDSSGHTSAVRLTGNGVDWGVHTYRNGTVGDRQQARVAFKLSQVGTGAVIALETTDANYYVGLYEEAGALKLRTRQGGSYSNSALLMTGVVTNTWYVLELGADHAAGMRVSVWAESNSGTRYEARAEAPRSMSWRFHAWVKQGQMWLDGSQGDGYSYVEERPALSGADARLVGKHYEYDSVSAQTTKRYYVGGRLIATRTGSSVRYVHADHLGSTTTLTDPSGAVVAREKYSAFGERRRGESPLVTDQLYTGQRYNALSSLYHYSDGTSAGRFYDPLLGRFVSADPTTPPLPESVAQPEATSSNPPSFPNTTTTSTVRTAEVYPDRSASAREDHNATARGWVSQPTSATSRIIPKEEKGFSLPESIPQAPSLKKTDPQQLNRFSYVRNNPLKYTDPTGYWTLSVSWGGTGFGIVGGRFSAVQVAIDNKGNVGVFSGVGGGGYGGFGGGFGPSIQVTGVPTIHDLRGWSVQLGLTGGELVGGTGEVVFMDKGVGFSLGGKVTALIPPAIVYGSAEHSWLWLEGNIWNLMPRPKEE